MENEIKDIMNTLWSIYKKFQQTHDVKQFTEEAATMVHKYDGDSMLLCFAQNLVISFAPMVNELKRRYNEVGGA